MAKKVINPEKKEELSKDPKFDLGRKVDGMSRKLKVRHKKTKKVIEVSRDHFIANDASLELVK